MLQSRRRPRNINVMLQVTLFKGSNCGVVDVMMVISFCMCAVVSLPGNTKLCYFALLRRQSLEGHN